MVAIKSGDIDALLRRPDSRYSVFLVFGPDSGLVAERAKLLAEQAINDPNDAFQLIRLDGDAVASDPLKLADEANTIGLFGGRRSIWVKPTSRNLVSAVAPLLNAPPEGATIVIEAGDLAKNSPLRTACERAPTAAAIPCYVDGPREVATLIDDMMREAGLRIGREAREHLASHLGGDRIATRNEIGKLALYAHGRTEVTIDDIDAVIGDVSTLATDAVVDAAFGGDLRALDEAFVKMAAEGLDAGVLMGFALRHALTLAQARLRVDDDASPQAAVETMRVHFRRKAAAERQIRLWTSAALAEAIAECGRAIAMIRRQGALAPATAQKSLWGLALSARRAGRVA
jgi:DNA polymerase-3 subunit delta